MRRYVPGAGLDDYAAYTAGTGTGITRQWPVTDPGGSVVGITNGSSVATQINTYDEYGVPGSSFSGRFGYAGSMSLNRAMAAPWSMRNRQYNPTLGRFMQTDPIGINGGVNLYGYVGNDPVNMVDPWGLQENCGGNGEPPCRDLDIVITAPRCRVVTCIVDPFDIDRFLERFGWGGPDGPGHGTMDEQPCSVPEPGLGRRALNRRLNTQAAVSGVLRPNSVADPGFAPRAILFAASLPGSIDDTKSYLPGSEEFGNFMFGANGAATGLTETEVLIWAQGAQVVQNIRSGAFQNDLNNGRIPSFSDNPGDTSAISAGYDYYRRGCSR